MAKLPQGTLRGARPLVTFRRHWQSRTIRRCGAIVIILVLAGVDRAMGQNTSLAIGDQSVKQNAVLFLNSASKNQGLIVPLVTSRNSITGGPEAGLVVFDESDDKLYYHNGTSWVVVSPGSGSASDLRLGLSGNTLSLLNGSTTLHSVNIIGGTPLSSSPGQLIMWNGSQWTTISSVPTATGQVLKWNNSTKVWEAGTLDAAQGGTGDMLKSVYDANNDNTVDVASSVNFGLQPASQFLASPFGSIGQPTFRAIQTQDIPSLDASKISSGLLGTGRGGTGVLTSPLNGQLLVGNGVGYTLNTLSAGPGINITNGPGSISISSSGQSSPMTDNGDMIMGGVLGSPTRLAAGTNGQLLVVSGGSPSWQASGTLAFLNSVNSSTISDATIANEDVSGTAAIAGTKISPAFGSQNIGTTGTLSSGAITTTNLASINSVSYIWPGGQGVANTFLANNGAGVLTWTGALTTTLTAANILVGNASHVAVGVAMTGDATISNTGSVTISNNAVESPEISDGSVVDSDINASASIAGTKISPAFGSLDISTTGALSSGEITTTNLSSINSVPYTWPGGQGAANSFLVNNGSGVLSWTGALTSALTSANIFVGNALHEAAGVAMTGDATISNTGSVTISNNAVESAEISDESIVDSDINPSAAIDGTKINPAFGSQNISTTGTLFSGALTATNLASINSVPYTWPGGQGAANSFLVNDGSGVLSWMGALTSTLIDDGAIVDTDINPSAAIDGTKINPAFGSQNISTTGTLFSGALTATNLASINSVPYTWPAGQGAANSFLVNDGSGVLSWMGALTSTLIDDGAIVDTDINPSAAIDGTKINPAFGSQNISTTGTLFSGALTTTNLASINSVSYTWPGGQGAANSFLMNDGAGVLSWTGALTPTLTSANILVGNASHKATGVEMSGDATISNSGAVTISNDAVESAEISDGAIVDTDISSSAAIDGTKVSPVFGSQNISTTGTISSGALTTTNLASINSVPYAWPGGQGAANSFLVNNGSGVLSWMDALTSTLIDDGTIVDTDINLSAAIDGTKINPAFGSQNISTTGTLFSGPITTTNLASINSVPYTWPGGQGVANSFLGNNGSGVLSWMGALSPTLTSANIFVGNASHEAVGVAMSGDATISNTGSVTISNDAVESAEISDGSLVDADINALAAIAGTKVSPDFGSQSITTTGTLSVNGTTTFNSQTYTWPTAVAGVGTVLTNDGAGTLAWGSASGGGAANSVSLTAGESISAGNIVYQNLQTGSVFVSTTTAPDKVRAIGVATETKSAGQSIKVQIAGNFTTSGLTTSTAYYLGESGAPTTTPSGVRMGYATSSTDLALSIAQDDKDMVGTVKAYTKSLAGIPINNLTAHWKECNGAILTDAESLLNGQTLPNLNARFLRGSTTSGATGGSESHNHTLANGKGDTGGTQDFDVVPSTTSTSNHLPPYYEVVYIIKIK